MLPLEITYIIHKIYAKEDIGQMEQYKGGALLLLVIAWNLSFTIKKEEVIAWN